LAHWLDHWLERRGLLTRMHLDSYHSYTVCDDGHHHHLLCRSCGRVEFATLWGVGDGR